MIVKDHQVPTNRKSGSGAKGKEWPLGGVKDKGLAIITNALVEAERSNYRTRSREITNRSTERVEIIHTQFSK